MGLEAGPVSRPKFWPRSRPLFRNFGPALVFWPGHLGLGFGHIAIFFLDIILKAETLCF